MLAFLFIHEQRGGEKGGTTQPPCTHRRAQPGPAARPCFGEMPQGHNTAIQSTSGTPARANPDPEAVGGGNKFLRNTTPWHRAGAMEKGTRGEIDPRRAAAKALLQTSDSISLQRDGNSQCQQKSGILTDGASNPAPQAQFPPLPHCSVFSHCISSFTVV